jgi:4'-phosphopantetheinyl transferase
MKMIFSNPVWVTAPTEVSILSEDVHIWRISLDRPQIELQDLRKTLSEDEIARAERFYFEEHRQNFIAGRGILRKILSQYLNIQPQQVQFSYEAKGKPVLADKFCMSKISFNLSHSQGLALCAISCVRSIGVDLEYMRPMEVEALSERFFSVREHEFICSLPPEERQEIFFRYWTCKEAYLKATGVGLTHLENIELSLAPEQPAKIISDEDWCLFELLPADNFLSAVAVAGSGFNIKYWQY